MPIQLDTLQRRVVEHERGPLRVVGGFGSGKTTALYARVERARGNGRRPLLLAHHALVGFALDILRRQGAKLTLVGDDERLDIVSGLIDHDVAEVASAVVGFQASFLGDEELRVHADAAGCLDVAEELIAITSRYLAELDRRRLVDRGGVVVGASTLLRDPAVAAAERAAFDELLVDDFQLATFGESRLLTQLAGPGGALVVAGHPEAAASDDPLSSVAYLQRFDRRFGSDHIELQAVHRRATATVRIVAGGDAAVAVAVEEAMGEGARLGIAAENRALLDRNNVTQFVGRECELAIVLGATEGRWPLPRPQPRWFDPELFYGPDVPDDDVRNRRWWDSERRRFGVATSRATRHVVILGEEPLSPFVGAFDIVDAPD